MLTFIITIAAAAMFNAVMDTIRFHHYSWIFSLAEKLCGARGKAWLRAVWIPSWRAGTHWIWPSDGWHVSKLLMLSLIATSFLFVAPNLIYIIVFFTVWGVSFTFFFNFLFAINA